MRQAQAAADFAELLKRARRSNVTGHRSDSALTPYICKR
jgi:hypothetical protein